MISIADLFRTGYDSIAFLSSTDLDMVLYWKASLREEDLGVQSDIFDLIDLA